MRPVKSHTFRGRRWWLRWKRFRLDQAGECEAPHVTGKTISIDPRLADLKLLETLIHEGIHACQWDLAEEAVHSTAADIARLLWRVGYRLPGDE